MKELMLVNEPVIESIPIQTASVVVSTFEKVMLDFSREANRPLSLDLIRSALPEGKEVARIDDIVDVGRVLGIYPKPLKTKVSDLTDDECPALVQYHDDEFVVIMKVNSPDSFDVLEPNGLLENLEIDQQVYTNNFNSIHQLQLETGQTTKGWGWLVRPLKESKWAYGQVLLAALMINFLALSTSIFTMVVYDRVLPNGATESLVALTLGVTIALIFDIIIKMIRGWFLDGAGSRADVRIGEKLFEQLIAIDISARRDSIGGLSSVMREFETLRDFLTSATLVALIDLPFIVIFLLAIYALGGPIVLVPAVLVPIVIISGVLSQPFLSKLAQESLNESKNKQSILVETITGLEVLKTSMAFKEMRRRWRDALVSQSGSSLKSRLVSQLVINFSAFAQQIAQVGIVVVGAYQVSQGNLTMGGLIASVILTGRTMAPLAQVANVLTRLVSAKTSFRAIDEFMQSPVDRSPQARYLTKAKIQGNIHFRNVDFSYPNQEQKALSNINLVIKPGEKIALLGKIGSGKSTLARLLLGLYSPTSGAVLIDDTDVRQIDPYDIRRSFSFVTQDTWLFSGSARDNICSGSGVVTDEELLKVAKIAGVHDFLGHHPQGYDMPLRERGEGLSAGQRQAISIARALTGEHSVVVMDEPTSMMDTASELSFVKRMIEFSQGKTLLVITHRNAILELVDRVVIFDQGKIIADGPKSILARGKVNTAQKNTSGDS
jgi:ATP-binding cassette, subfamily C, bacterial LapB